MILYDILGLDGKESACNADDLGSIPGLGRSPGEAKGYPSNIPAGELHGQSEKVEPCKLGRELSLEL